MLNILYTKNISLYITYKDNLINILDDIKLILMNLPLVNLLCDWFRFFENNNIINYELKNVFF